MRSLAAVPRRSAKRLYDLDVLPFQGLEKGQVIQNVKIFSAAKLKTRECYFLLTKVPCPPPPILFLSFFFFIFFPFRFCT